MTTIFLSTAPMTTTLITARAWPTRPAFRERLPAFLPLDSIQEFNTQESPSADYGVKPGVVMNIGIKSGTNHIHGSAYYFNRNTAYDARNYFNPAPQPFSALNMHEFGASIGGPIKKDKWFYFVNYEGIRDKVGNPGRDGQPGNGITGNADGRDCERWMASPNSALYSVPDAIAYFSTNPNSVAVLPGELRFLCGVRGEPAESAAERIVPAESGVHDVAERPRRTLISISITTIAETIWLRRRILF